MYPYYPYCLGIYIPTSQLCRLPHPCICDWIPVGFARILRHRARWNQARRIYAGPMIFPYNVIKIYKNHYWEWDTLELKESYNSLFRWTDIQHQQRLERTGPVMLSIFMANDKEQLDR